jgi:hypothetical protein
MEKRKIAGQAPILYKKSILRLVTRCEEMVMKCLFTCIMLAFFTVGAIGQDEKKPFSDESVAGCEVVMRVLSTVNNLRVNDNIIVISRLGKGESSISLSRKRLNQIRDYLQGSWKRRRETIILATGENADGFGRIEFYVVGMLADVLYVKKNQLLRLYCSDKG